MGIGGISAVDSTSGGSRTQQVQPVDSVSKDIQNEIANVQRQKKELSSKEDMTSEEKVKKRKELQKELSSLNTKLRQHQAEVRRERQKETLESKEKAEKSGVQDTEQKGRKGKGAVKTEAADKNAAKKGRAKTEETSGASGVKNTGAADSKGTEGKTEKKSQAVKETGSKTPVGREAVIKEALKASDDRGAAVKEAIKKEVTGSDAAKTEPVQKDTGISSEKMQELIEMDSAKEQVKSQGIVIARMEEGIVILKGEIRQDEMLGSDVKKKQAEVAKQEQKVQKASDSRFTGLGNAYKKMKQASQTRTDKVRGNVGGNVKRNPEGKVEIRSTNFSKEKLAARQ